MEEILKMINELIEAKEESVQIDLLFAIKHSFDISSDAD